MQERYGNLTEGTNLHNKCDICNDFEKKLTKMLTFTFISTNILILQVLL